ncbi:MAG: hypothetical protein SF052_16125 [Bacteroidia bacterium]|nr:hypothetical protein [Bacteroidia bacterium]
MDGVELEGLERIDLLAKSLNRDNSITLETSVDLNIKVVNVSSSEFHPGISFRKKESLLEGSLLDTGSALTFAFKYGISFLNPQGTILEGNTEIVHNKLNRLSVSYTQIHSISEVEDGDFVMLVVDDIHKSLEPPDDLIKNPWVDPAGFASLGGWIQVVEYNPFVEDERVAVHEMLHSLGLEHWDHSVKNLMSYLGGSNLNTVQTKQVMGEWLNVLRGSLYGNRDTFLSPKPQKEDIINSLKSETKQNSRVDYNNDKLNKFLHED